MLSALRPVGERFPLRFTASDENELGNIPDYQFHGFASGTQALAAAILHVRKQRADCTEPEVIIPAYTCPDVVSACVRAKVKPVLVDFAENSTQYDLPSLKQRVTDQTIAIIAINFLGIPIDIPELRNVIGSKNIVVIEDSAQYFPRDITKHGWQGDLVILSFGRGKPLNLFYGGAVLSQSAVAFGIGFNFSENILSRQKFAFKHRLYNTLMHPGLYFWITQLPGLTIGQTHYQTCSLIESMSSDAQAALNNRIKDYKALESNTKVLDWAKAISFKGQLISHRSYKYLRLPFLVDDATKLEYCESKPEFEKLGLSRMYRKILPEFDDIPIDLGNSKDYPNALSFSRRLFTLPVHGDVKSHHLKKVEHLLSKI